MATSLLLAALLALLPAALAQEPPATEAPAGEQEVVRVRLRTSLGDMVFGLDATRTPVTTGNFLRYAQDDFYDGTIFHRVLATFMVQGGGLTTDLTPRPTRAPIPNEAHQGGKNVRGSIAMARTPDPHSATAQFFVNVVDNGMLDHRTKSPEGWGYAAFGTLLEGEATLEAIRTVPVELNPAVGTEEAFPTTPVVIEDVEILDPELAARVIARGAEAESAIAAERQAATDEKTTRDDQQRQAALAFAREQGVDVAAARTLASGLVVIDVVEGTGPSPRATDMVSVDYALWTAADGTKIDASADHPGGGPFRTRLDQVIQGWTEGVTGMKEGGERWLVVPPHLGYGERPVGPMAAGSTLVFQVKLLKVGG